jgi:hypothetical protein
LHVNTYPDMTSLWHEEAQGMLFSKKKDLDYIASIDSIKYDNVLTAESMAFDFDLGRDLWLTKSRFTVLQRDYLDLSTLSAFLDRCESIGLGEAKRGVITQMPTKLHTMRARKYRWGPCMMGYTFRGGDRYQQPTLSLHSRVTYIPYIGGADLALAHVLAREIGARIGLTPKDFSFTWHLDSMQFHYFKGIPYLFRFGFEDILIDDSDEYPSAKYPTLRGVRKWWKGMVKDYEDEVPLSAQKYGPLKRIRKRYQQFQEGNPLPSVPIDQLTLQPLYDRG